MSRFRVGNDIDMSRLDTYTVTMIHFIEESDRSTLDIYTHNNTLHYKGIIQNSNLERIQKNI